MALGSHVLLLTYHSVLLSRPCVNSVCVPLPSSSGIGADITNAKKEDAGDLLAEQLRKFMFDLNVPNGISEFGFGASDALDLVKAAMPNVCTRIWFHLYNQFAAVYCLTVDVLWWCGSAYWESLGIGWRGIFKSYFWQGY